MAKATGVHCNELFDRTAGNPFFVTEALAAGTAGVPSTVRDAVLARAARLTPSARVLLDAVAIVPQKTELWLLEALVDGPEGDVEECLRSGMLSALLVLARVRARRGDPEYRHSSRSSSRSSLARRH
jgi:hypothetical protein